jgi:2-dehydro-3-deoxyphosphogluconate aldolase/(4S)-4-hydroxy-2-oxoglutarate aldolase
MHEAMSNSVQQSLADRGVVAVLEIDDAETAVPTARALVDGGITAIELALRTPAALASIGRIAREVPGMMIGAGTVILGGQAKEVKNLGAAFAVAPGYNPRIVEEALECGLPFAPGIATPTELEAAYAQGCSFMKFFPAAYIGGIEYFKGMSGPYSYLGIKFFPLGGITEEALADWAALEQVLAIGGSWIAKRDLIKAGRYGEITKRATRAKEIWNQIRGKALP